MLSSGFIGFGDACFNTQIYSLLMRWVKCAGARDEKILQRTFGRTTCTKYDLVLLIHLENSLLDPCRAARNSAYAENSVAAFALFKFVQSVGSALAFLYSTTLNLHHQLYLLAVIASMATISFCIVEGQIKSKKAGGNMEKSESKQNIITRNDSDTNVPATLTQASNAPEFCHKGQRIPSP